MMMMVVGMVVSGSRHISVMCTIARPYFGWITNQARTYSPLSDSRERGFSPDLNADEMSTVNAISHPKKAFRY
jgi:hypothetical protein